MASLSVKKFKFDSYLTKIQKKNQYIRFWIEFVFILGKIHKYRYNVLIYFEVINRESV